MSEQIEKPTMYGAAAVRGALLAALAEHGARTTLSLYWIVKGQGHIPPEEACACWRAHNKKKWARLKEELSEQKLSEKLSEWVEIGGRRLVSQHLCALRKQGLVATETFGDSVRWRLTEAGSTRVVETVEDSTTIRGRIVEAADVAVPDFTFEWMQIREGLESEADCALRIGQNLIKIRDVMKPLGLWLEELKKHGMSQPQASRYIRYAGLPECDRAAFQRANGFSLTEAVGEGRRKKDATQKPTEAPEIEAPIPEDERADRLAEIEQQIKLAIKLVDLGEAQLTNEPSPYADDDARWASRVAEIADDVRAVLIAGLEAELKKRLGRS